MVSRMVSGDDCWGDFQILGVLLEATEQREEEDEEVGEMN